MYEKARRGESIELSPRRISIFQFDIERSLDDRYPRFFLDVDKLWPMKAIIVEVVKSYIYLMHFRRIIYLEFTSFFFSWTC